MKKVFEKEMLVAGRVHDNDYYREKYIEIFNLDGSPYKIESIGLSDFVNFTDPDPDRPNNLDNDYFKPVKTRLTVVLETID